LSSLFPTYTGWRRKKVKRTGDWDISCTLCTTTFLKLNCIAFSMSRILLFVPLLQLTSSDQILRIPTGSSLEVQERIEYRIISTKYKLLQFSSPQYLCSVIASQPPRSAVVTFARLPMQSRSPTVFFTLQHLSCGINLLSMFHISQLCHASRLIL